MFSMVFMFTSRNVLTVLKILIRVPERNMYRFPAKNPIHTYKKKTQTKTKTKNKLHKLWILNQNWLELVLFRTWLLFISALVLIYQSTAMVYLGTWFQKAIARKRIWFMNSLKAKGRSPVSHLFYWYNSTSLHFPVSEMRNRPCILLSLYMQE